MKAVLKMQINKSYCNDAIGIARIMQTGWFKEVHVKDIGGGGGGGGGEKKKKKKGGGGGGGGGMPCCGVIYLKQPGFC